jgi:hypothetical protein
VGRRSMENLGLGASCNLKIRHLIL